MPEDGTGKAALSQEHDQSIGELYRGASFRPVDTVLDQRRFDYAMQFRQGLVPGAQDCGDTLAARAARLLLGLGRKS